MDFSSSEIARMEVAAKQHISANIGEDRVDLLTKVDFLFGLFGNNSFLQERQQWAIDDRKAEDKAIQSRAKFTSNIARKFILVEALGMKYVLFI